MEEQQLETAYANGRQGMISRILWAGLFIPLQENKRKLHKRAIHTNHLTQKGFEYQLPFQKKSYEDTLVKDIYKDIVGH